MLVALENEKADEETTEEEGEMSEDIWIHFSCIIVQHPSHNLCLCQKYHTPRKIFMKSPKILKFI